MLNWIMIQCAHIHVLNCNSSITRHYNKIKETKGAKIAIVAAARKLDVRNLHDAEVRKSLQAGRLEP